MKSAVRRKKQQDELRAKILDAARELFVAQGVEAVSMRKVAEKIGYTATTLYNHFEDKDALLRALCEADFGALDESFIRIGRIADPIERLHKLGEAYIEFALSHPGHYRFMFMTPHPHRDETVCEESGAGDPERDAYAFVRATLIEACAAGLFRDDYEDPDLLAQVFWSGVHGVAALHLTMGKDGWLNWRPAAEVARTAIELIIRGLLRNGRGQKGKNGV